MIERVKNYSEIVKEVNFEKRPRHTDPGEQKRQNEPSKRDKMLEFAKRIILPQQRKRTSLPPQRNAQQPLSEQNQPSMSEQIEFLEGQHQAYQQKLRQLHIG